MEVRSSFSLDLLAFVRDIRVPSLVQVSLDVVVREASWLPIRDTIPLPALALRMALRSTMLATDDRRSHDCFMADYGPKQLVCRSK